MKYEIRIHNKLVATVHQEDYLIDIIKATGAKINDVVDISLQAAAVQAEPKPIDPEHLYPHMQYGLPRYYAVIFGKCTTRAMRVKVMDRYNIIHATGWWGGFNFYGFDGKADFWNAFFLFEKPVLILTAGEFLQITDKYFNTPQK